jgi:DNA-binding HxlR family transcriptional regulator
VDLEHLAAATHLVGDRWSLLLLGSLLEGPATFQQLTDRLGISPAVLSSRLKHLESAGLVVAVPYQRRPVRFTYEPTARGEALRDALVALAAWGGEAVVHDVCGTEATLQWWCPTCQVPVDAAEGALRRL